MSDIRIMKCVVAATNANGAADFLPLCLEVTPEMIENGAHFDLAIHVAFQKGYENPMLVFDEDEAPAWLLERYEWDRMEKFSEISWGAPADAGTK